MGPSLASVASNPARSPARLQPATAAGHSAVPLIPRTIPSAFSIGIASR